MAVKGKKHLAGRETADQAKLDANTDEKWDEGPPPQKEPATPQFVRQGLMLTKYLRPEFDVNKDDERIVGFECSMTLTDAHRDILPKHVIDAWDFLRESENKSVSLIFSEPFIAEFFLEPEAKTADLKLVGAWLQSATIAMIEQTGAGEAVTVPRFKFAIWIDLNSTVEKFACQKYNRQLWLRIAEQQGTLPT